MRRAALCGAIVVVACAPERERLPASRLVVTEPSASASPATSAALSPAAPASVSARPAAAAAPKIEEDEATRRACLSALEGLEREVEGTRRCTKDADCRATPLGGCFDLCGPLALNAARVPANLAARVREHTEGCGFRCSVPRCVGRPKPEPACIDARCGYPTL